MLLAQQRKIDLKEIRKEHPRILLTPEALELMQERYWNNSDSFFNSIVSLILNQAKKDLDQTSVDYSLDEPLHFSRKCVAMVINLSLAYKFTNDSIYLNKATEIMEMVSSLSTWNSKNRFLHPAEMTTALSLGLDWLYDDLNDITKKNIVNAIYKNGILEFNKESKKYKKISSTDNWNPVCNGGVMLGVLTVYGEEDLDTEILQKVISTNISNIEKIFIPQYESSGAYHESLIYWRYATTYLTIVLSALGTSFENDFEITKHTGLKNTADFSIAATEPNSNRPFNFGDGVRISFINYPLLWFSKTYSKPFYSDYFWSTISDYFSKERSKPYSTDRFMGLMAIWYVKKKSSDFNKWFEGIKFFEGEKNSLVSYKSSALYFAIRGGTNNLNHQQLDVGTFAFTKNKVPWVLNMGKDDYCLDGYFSKVKKKEDKNRWDYFRNNNLSHNCLTFDQDLQEIGNIAKFVEIDTTNINNINVSLDLSNIYEDKALKYIRKVNILDQNRIIIKDEIKKIEDAKAFNWQVVTRVDSMVLSANKKNATLFKRNEILQVQLLQPKKANFEIYRNLPEQILCNDDSNDCCENRNKLYTILSITYEVRKNKNYDIEVQFE